MGCGRDRRQHGDQGGLDHQRYRERQQQADARLHIGVAEPRQLHESGADPREDQHEGIDLARQGLIERQGREIHFKDGNEMLRVASFQPSYLE